MQWEGGLFKTLVKLPAWFSFIDFTLDFIQTYSEKCIFNTTKTKAAILAPRVVQREKVQAENHNISQ